MRKRIGFTAVVAAVLLATMASSVTPAAAWCGRWGRCGGFGWGPFAVGAVAGAVVAGAAVAATRPGPGPYGPGPGPYYGRPGGGYYACPAGYHWGPGGRACFAN